MDPSNGGAVSPRPEVTTSAEPSARDRQGDTAPELSICIPTYRRPQMFERALRSAMSASRAAESEVELLVSDNSPSETESLARALLDEWPGRSTYLANATNIGLVGNLNQCVARAGGRWIQILHDDDYLMPGAVDTVHDAVRTSAPDDRVLLFGTTVVDQFGRVLRRQISRRDVRLTPVQALRRVLTDSSFVRFPAIAVHRDAYHETGLFSSSAEQATDFDMWIRLFAKYGVRLVPHAVSSYTVHDGALTSGMFNRQYVELLTGRFSDALATGLLSPEEVHRAQREWFHQFLLAGAYRSVRAGDLAEARRVMELFDEPSVKALGRSRRWSPIRVGMTAITRMPRPLALLAARLIRPLDRRVKGRMLDGEGS